MAAGYRSHEWRPEVAGHDEPAHVGMQEPVDRAVRVAVPAGERVVLQMTAASRTGLDIPVMHPSAIRTNRLAGCAAKARWMSIGGSRRSARSRRPEPELITNQAASVMPRVSGSVVLSRGTPHLPRDLRALNVHPPEASSRGIRRTGAS